MLFRCHLREFFLFIIDIGCLHKNFDPWLIILHSSLNVDDVKKYWLFPQIQSTYVYKKSHSINHKTFTKKNFFQSQFYEAKFIYMTSSKIC